MENYWVVLFKNKTKRRIIKKFITFKKAQTFFKKKVRENENVIFETKFENGLQCEFEIGLVELSNKQLFPVYMTDEMGRNIKVKLEDENMTLVEISPYKKEEKIFDTQTKEKIDTHQLIKKYLKGDTTKLISTLNNKLIVQVDDNNYIFSLKNEDESSRFIDCLSKYFFKIKRMDCLMVKDYSSAQRKYLYEILEKSGLDKKILYRKFTTYPRRGESKI